MFRPIRGKGLDKIAEIYGMKRKRVWFLIKESDQSLRERIIQKLRIAQ